MNVLHDWIDIPIVSAMDYFQGLLGYFLNFARTYGCFFGMIGLVWTALRLVNSRIDLRSAWWDSLSKWFIFLLLINFYAAGTTFVAKVVTDIGLSAGNGKSTIVKNFVSLKTRIESELNVYDKWMNGLTDLVYSELGIKLDYIGPEEDFDEWIQDAYKDFNKYEFESKAQSKAFFNKLDNYFATAPESEQSIWGSQTLEALNSILISESADGSSKTNLTGAYITENPELNIWLKDSKGQATNYLSSSAVFRIGILTAQIIWEKVFMDVTEKTHSDGSVEYKVKKNTKFSHKKIGTYIMAGISCICIIVSVAFALIQYVMCILEYTIVQGIGAAFIPFYLFDGTKDIPKKLLPVFTGFIIKILVMVICLMFVISMYLVFAAEQISPTSGNMGFPAFGQCIFICLLSFVLTSNAPKIAMTLLTGQPQLSMGELVQAAGTMVAGGVGAKNLASTVTSPMAAAAKNKAHQWSEQTAASSAAKKKQTAQMKSEFAKSQGIDTTSREGRKYVDQKWKEYSKSDGAKELIRNKTNEAGSRAKNEVKELQKTEFMKNGGVAGTAGRLLAHYGGALVNPTSTLRQGRNYQAPIGNIDLDRISSNNVADNALDSLSKLPDPSSESKENNSSDNPKGIGGDRQVE